LPDVLVVVDHYCGEGAKVQTQDIGAVFLGQLIQSYVSELKMLEQQEPVTSPHRQAGRTCNTFSTEEMVKKENVNSNHTSHRNPNICALFSRLFLLYVLPTILFLI
jgi:hypothetical protein